MQNMTADYRDILPDNQFMYVDGGMQLYTEPNSEAVSSVVQGLDITLSDVLTFNSSLDRVYVLIPTATEGYQWLIHGEYSASLEEIVEIEWSAVEAPDGSIVYPPDVGADETITQFIESTFTYVIYNRTTATYRAVQVWTEPEMDTNFWDNEQEVFNQNYAIRTTDDVLMQLWIRQCGGTPETYSRVYAEECFRRYYGNAISDALNQWAYSGRSALMAIPNVGVVVDQEALELWESVASQSPDLTMSDMQSRGVLGLHLTQEVIAGRLNNLPLEAIVDLYTALLSPSYETYGEDAVHLQDEASYIEAIRNALIWESGGVGDTSGFVPDLATQDWLDENPDYNNYEDLFNQIVDLILNGAYLGIFFGRFTYPSGLLEAGNTYNDRLYFSGFTHGNAVNILNQYIQGQNQFTYADLVRLGVELAEEHLSITSDPSWGAEDPAIASAYEWNVDARNLQSYGQGYEDRIALDNLRAVIFDSAWNPTTELAQLETLNGLISEMPTSILGVDVSFAQAGMQEYHNLMLHQVQWHIQMQVHLTNVDRELLRRQAQGIPWQTLWWLGEFALAFLFEPLDWYITIRDIGMGIANGNLSAWDFLGFLPILTNRLGDIAQLMARSDVDEYVQHADEYFQISQDFSAGGFVQQINPNLVYEQPSNYIVRQELTHSCQAACGLQMLLDVADDLNIDVNFTEQMVRDAMEKRGISWDNGILPSTGSLGDSLNDLIEETPLQGRVSFLDGMIEPESVATINANLPFSASVGGHQFIVDSIDFDEGFVYLRDPWGPNRYSTVQWAQATGSEIVLTWDYFQQQWLRGGFQVVVRQFTDGG